MSTLREVIAELRELGPGAIMLVLGAVIVMGVLTLFGQVYHENAGDNLAVHVVAGFAFLVAVGLFVFGAWFLRRSVESNLWDMGIIGRRFLNGEEVLKRIQEAKSVTILKTWFPEKHEIAEALKTALQNGASVELILCEPDSDILKNRCEGAGVEHSDAKEWIFKGLRIVRDHANKPGQFKGVVLHKAWPGCPVIRADERIYMGFYFRGNTSPNFPWVEIRKNSTLDGFLQRQAAELRNKAVQSFDSPDALSDWLEGQR